MSPRRGHSRSRYPDKGPRRQSRLVLVIGDGESERRYFERLSDLCESVRIKAYASAKTGPDVLLRKTMEHARDHGLDPSQGDVVAIVMDLDDRFTRAQIEDMSRKCSQLGYHLFISNPSFEVWLLCHLRLPTHPYTPAELVEEMGRAMGGQYVKSKGFDIDEGSVERAMANARVLLPGDGCGALDCFERNPSTMAHLLVGEILERRSSRTRRER